MKKVLVIAGPTASGKSGFAIEAAKKLNGIIISGDSIQVYKGFDIGSGKVTQEEAEGIPHALLDILEPKEHYSVADFQREARRIIAATDRFPVICGGTGLYLKACLYDYTFNQDVSVSVDPQLERYSTKELWHMLKVLDPAQTEKIHPNNRRRLLRSLTIVTTTGKKQSQMHEEQEHQPVYDIFIAGCTMDRQKLYDRIDQRVEGMFQAGLKEEIKALLEEGCTFDDQAMQGIGYKEWKGYFYGEDQEVDVMHAIQTHSHQFAKRQYTWLNHQMPVHWFQSDDAQDRKRMLKEIEDWAYAE